MQVIRREYKIIDPHRVGFFRVQVELLAGMACPDFDCFCDGPCRLDKLHNSCKISDGHRKAVGISIYSWLESIECEKNNRPLVSTRGIRHLMDGASWHISSAPLGVGLTVEFKIETVK